MAWGKSARASSWLPRKKKRLAWSIEFIALGTLQFLMPNVGEALNGYEDAN
jgi:hypothetical protein